MRWLAILLVVLVLGIVAWIVLPADAPSVVSVPLGATGELDFNLWPAPGGVRAVLWHQDIASSTNTRLVGVTLPAWPLLVLSAGSGIGASAWIALQRKRGRR